MNWATETLDLRVEVGEVAALQQRIIREIDAGNDVVVQNATCSVSGEKVVDTTIENQAADAPTGISSSGISLVASSTSKAKSSANSSSKS